MSDTIIAQTGYNFIPGILSLSESEASGLIYIEQLAATDGCKTPNRPWMVAQNADTKMAIFFRPTCKLWSCPYCAEVNARRWIVRGVLGATTLLAEGWHTDFVTITPHEKLTIAGSFRVLPLAWPKLYRRYKRAVSISDPKAFIAVPERHKSGKLHAHLIITGGLSQRWWKDNARQCGLGYESDVKEVKTLGVAGYMSKYLGKTLDEKWPKGKRRVNTSRSWPPLPEMPQKPGWSFATMPSDDQLSRVLADLLQRGYTPFGSTTQNAWALLDDLSPEIVLTD